MNFKQKNNRLFSLSSYALIVLTLCFTSCKKDPEIPSQWYNEEEYFAGGATTIFDVSSGAFSTPAENLTSDNAKKHEDGDGNFEQMFVTSPAASHFGLGPVYNNVSCKGCHTLDGRGAEPSVFRISIPGFSVNGGPNPAPGFGAQLQDKAVAGVAYEGKVTINYTEISGSYPDGNTYTLRQPAYTITDTYMPIPSDMLLSVRAAPPVFGLGLLEAIPESEILAVADPFDTNHDGISGKPNYVWSEETHSMALGRFGWKAGQPDLYQQTAAAFNEDMGITNPLFPDESCFGQSQYDGLNDDSEIDFTFLDDAAFYTKTLAVPAPRNLQNPNVQTGKMMFFEAKCNSCHIPRWQTGTLPGIAEVSEQIIYPYTDLLLHDMGDGLSDGRPDFDATGNEWKTRPLWGIGLTQIANGHTNFLHDCRARNIEEAILWHGGEAENAKQAFMHMTKSDREALITFINAL